MEKETYSEAETEARREAALKRLLATPPKPHKASKLKGKESRKNDGGKLARKKRHHPAMSYL